MIFALLSYTKNLLTGAPGAGVSKVDSARLHHAASAAMAQGEFQFSWNGGIERREQLISRAALQMGQQQQQRRGLTRLGETSACR
jgi:hypothetical protein